MAKMTAVCQLCHGRLHQQRDGSWYHNGNSSVFCRPGDGTGRKAIPVNVERAEF